MPALAICLANKSTGNDRSERAVVLEPVRPERGKRHFGCSHCLEQDSPTAARLPLQQTLARERENRELVCPAVELDAVRHRLIQLHTARSRVRLTGIELCCAAIVAIALGAGAVSRGDAYKRPRSSPQLQAKERSVPAIGYAALFRFAAFLGGFGGELASMNSSTSGRILLRQLLPANMP